MLHFGIRFACFQNVTVSFSYAKLVGLMTQGMISVRKHVARILTLVQVLFTHRHLHISSSITEHLCAAYVRHCWLCIPVLQAGTACSRRPACEVLQLLIATRNIKHFVISAGLAAAESALTRGAGFSRSSLTQPCSRRCKAFCRSLGATSAAASTTIFSTKPMVFCIETEAGSVVEEIKKGDLECF